METTKPPRQMPPGVPPDTLTLTDQPAEIDGFTYPAEDAGHEHLLKCFSAGWHARDDEVAELRVRIERAEADADRYFRAAFDTPADVQDRITAAADEHWQLFLAGGSL